MDSQNKVDEYLDGLRGEEKRLRGELNEAEKQVRDLKAEIDRVQAGIKGLERKDTARKRERESQAATRLAREEVVEIASSVLESSGPLSEQELRWRIKTEATSRGKSAAGLGQKLRKTLEDERFVFGPEGWQLLKNASEAALEGEGEDVAYTRDHA